MSAGARSAHLPKAFGAQCFAFLAKERTITNELRAKMLGWCYCGGFSAHNQVRVGAEDRDGRMKLAGYMIRAPRSLEKMTHDAAPTA